MDAWLGRFGCPSAGRTLDAEVIVDSTLSPDVAAGVQRARIQIREVVCEVKRQMTLPEYKVPQPAQPQVFALRSSIWSMAMLLSVVSCRYRPCRSRTCCREVYYDGDWNFDECPSSKNLDIEAFQDHVVRFKWKEDIAQGVRDNSGQELLVIKYGYQPLDSDEPADQSFITY
ncbi:hypothetical protein S40285_10044 [Stachybotrys chlorohalonatus IBT 40285]|uniref:Uncharacterized protein n=1 Tax=Stachybotrys chlorohalonatus (strain IBT 40285) TaxID=1283841 RepID=A0A084QLT6_STAC4|nr:hypothetical protein S40285_10044 [Stachybotrys chlorohalonata IBT 40285]